MLLYHIKLILSFTTQYPNLNFVVQNSKEEVTKQFLKKWFEEIQKNYYNDMKTTSTKFIKVTYPKVSKTKFKTFIWELLKRKL